MALIYFVRADPTFGDEIFVTDGTVAGTHVAADVTPGGTGSSPGNLTDVNGTIFFTASNFAGSAGYELYKTDGTVGGTSLVKDINPVDELLPKDLTNVNGTLFFTADDGTNGRELWKSNGTAAGTTLVKIIDPDEFSDGPKNLTNVNGTLFFTADDGSGYALWRSDGTAAGTIKLKLIHPNATSGEISQLTNVNGTLFFQANDGTYVDHPGFNHDYELWKSDGTAAGTVLVKDIAPQGVGSSDPIELTNVNGTLYFQATDGGFFSIPSGHGYELWRSDGTVTGTAIVKDIHPEFSALSEDSLPIALTNVNGILFFIADDGVNGPELWKSDGTPAGTALVKNIFPGAEYFDNGILVNSLTNVNGTLFFMADDGTHGYELWKSNGTAAGTVLVKDIRPGSESSGILNNGIYLAVGNTLYFGVDDGSNPNGYELWRSDGTDAGTVKVSDNFDPLGPAAKLLLIGSNSGDDFLAGTTGADNLVGGLGNDTYVVDNVGDVVTENPGEGTDTVQTTLASYTLPDNVENLTFTDNGTHAGTGNALANVMTGGSGNDTFFAEAGADTLIGGDGNDTLVGNAGGSDTFATTVDTFDGGNGSDTLYVKATDVIQGGAGRDFVHLVNDNPININLGATGVEWIETLFGNDTINGASQTVGIEVYSDGGNDIITGSAFDDIIWSGSGNDTVTGGDGNDVIVGDIGADSISGGNGNDSLYVDASDTFIDGGAGFDAAYITGGTTVTLDLAATHIEFVADFVPGGSDDTIDGSGTSVNLEVYAGAGTDTVKGGSGNDFLWGEAGNDIVTGGSGNDTLVGGTGADTLTGGPGTDALYGNSGNGGDGAVDTFVFTPNWGTDFVFDFEHNIDKLDLTALGTTFAALTFTNTPDGHCYVSFGSNLIAVANHTTANLTAGDFIF